ncbi:hypothetical protein [Enterococcus sp. UD-01]|uniref:hypothetical protein n=1 Tax=Enterococcus sp. UD-01 TaxID=3373911 RepID=UPI0038361493
MDKKRVVKLGIIIGMIVFLGVTGMLEVKKMTEPTEKEKQIAFLKEHENEMIDYVKSQKFHIISENEKKHPVVKNVYFDYDDYDTYQRDAGGIPTGTYTIDITGKYNDSHEFELLIDVDSLSEPTEILNFERY